MEPPQVMCWLRASLLRHWLLLVVACSSACMDMRDHAWLSIKNDSISGIREVTLSASDVEVSLETLSPGQSAVLQIDEQLWSEGLETIQVGVRFVDEDGEKHEDSIVIPTQPGAVGEVQASLRDGGGIRWERSLKSR